MIDKIAQIAYSYRETVEHTYNSALYCIEKGLQGCFVECGVGAGAQIAAMEYANKMTGRNISIFAFDSFQGIPLGSVYDAEQPGIGVPKHDVTLPERDRLVSSGITVHSKGNVIQNIERLGLSTENISFIEGWFQDTVWAFNTPISLLRLDGDLYESTLVCLHKLYPLVVEGGVVIIDDYALDGCRKAVDKYFNGRVKMRKVEPKENGVYWFIKTSIYAKN